MDDSELQADPPPVASNGAKRMGPPSKLTPELVGNLLKALAGGLTFEQAAVSVGVHRQTIIRWREQYPELAEQLDQAREQARQKALGHIKSAAESGDWKAAECFLRMSFFPQYTKPDTNVNVGVQTQLFCTEETRQRLILLNQKLLSNSREVLADRENPNNESTSIFQTNSI